MHRNLCLSLGGAHQLLDEARRHGDALAVSEAESDVRKAEEALAWFEFQNGMSE